MPIKFLSQEKIIDVGTIKGLKTALRKRLNKGEAEIDIFTLGIICVGISVLIVSGASAIFDTLSFLLCKGDFQTRLPKKEPAIEEVYKKETKLQEEGYSILYFGNLGKGETINIELSEKCFDQTQMATVKLISIQSNLNEKILAVKCNTDSKVQGVGKGK